jgi:recombination protein RecA
MATKKTNPKAAEAALARFMEGGFTKKFSKVKLLTGLDYEVISSGSISLDYALGTGGWVEGRCVEIWGPDGTGKTTLALIGAAQAQAQHPDKNVVIFDIEAKLDLRWAKKLGVDMDRMVVIQPDSAEEMADMAQYVMDELAPSFLAIDSIGAMLSQEEIDKDAEAVVVGTLPKVITRMVKKLANAAKHTGTVVYLINQVRANLGYGAETTTGGGFALKHVTTHRIKVRKATGAPMTLGSGDDAVQAAFKIACKVEKNGVHAPGRTAIITIVSHPSAKYGMNYGIAAPGQAAFDVGKASGVITRRGAKYTLPDEAGTEVTGEEACVAMLDERPELVESIRKAAIASLSAEQREIVPVSLEAV